MLIAPVVKYVLELTDMAEFGVKKRSATYDKPLRGGGRGRGGLEGGCEEGERRVRPSASGNYSHLVINCIGICGFS